MNTNQAELTNLIQAEIRQNNHQMLEAMQKMLDNSVSQSKRSASESAESQLQEIKKLKYNEPHKFKKRANEDQFKFNSKVIDTMNDAATALECKDYTRTKDEIKKGMGHKPGSCFACGKEGHWRATCPQVLPKS